MLGIPKVMLFVLIILCDQFGRRGFGQHFSEAIPLHSLAVHPPEGPRTQKNLRQMKQIWSKMRKRPPESLKKYWLEQHFAT